MCVCGPPQKVCALRAKHDEKMDVLSGKKKKKSKRKDGLSGEDIYSAKLLTMKDNEKKKEYKFPDINKGFRDNQTLLYWACMRGDVKTIKRLMKKSSPPDINWINSANGMTTRAYCELGKGMLVSCVCCVSLCANMNIKDKKGRTVEEIVEKCSTSNDPSVCTRKKNEN